MSSTVLFVTISLDGYAAGPDGDLTRLHRWILHPAGDAGRRFSTAHTDRFASAGAIVFGRRTWDSGQEPWGDEDVFAAPVFVATHEMLPPVARNGTVFTFVSGDVRDILAHARDAAGDADVLVMGSPDVAQQFLEAGLIDELLLHVVPVLLGDGTPLFGTRGAPVELSLTSFERGPDAASMTYQVRHDA